MFFYFVLHMFIFFSFCRSSVFNLQFSIFGCRSKDNFINPSGTEYWHCEYPTPIGNYLRRLADHFIGMYQCAESDDDLMQCLDESGLCNVVDRTLAQYMKQSIPYQITNAFSVIPVCDGPSILRWTTAEILDPHWVLVRRYMARQDNVLASLESCMIPIGDHFRGAETIIEMVGGIFMVARNDHNVWQIDSIDPWKIGRTLMK